MVKTLQKSSSQEPKGQSVTVKICIWHLGLELITVCSNDDVMVDLDLIYDLVNFGMLCFYMRKC